jgi:hypothetical protein
LNKISFNLIASCFFPKSPLASARIFSKAPFARFRNCSLLLLSVSSYAISSQQMQVQCGAWFAGVWHLNTVLTDSTSVHNDGTNTGTTDATGRIANGRQFSGSGQYITTPSMELYTASEYSMSAWFKAGATDFAHHLIWEGNVTGDGWGESISAGESDSKQL